MHVLLHSGVVGVHIDNHGLQQAGQSTSCLLGTRESSHHSTLPGEIALEEFGQFAVSERNDRLLLGLNTLAGHIETLKRFETHLLALLLADLVAPQHLHALTEHHETLVNVTSFTKSVS